MTHPASERLSAYLDGDLDPEARRDVETHLAACGQCAELLSDLRRVLARAQALEDRPPRQDLWPGVAAAIGAAPSRRRGVTIPVPILLAAGVALMLLSGGAVAWLLGRGAGAPVAAAPSAPAGVSPVLASAPDETRGYDAAIRRLEAEVAAGGGRLDSVTVRVVRQKLVLIDKAILEAERALAADSGNTYLHGHLAETRLRKLDLLRQAAALTRRVS